MTAEEPHLRFYVDMNTYAEVHTYAEMHVFTHTHLHLNIYKIDIIKPVNPSMNN